MKREPDQYPQAINFVTAERERLGLPVLRLRAGSQDLNLRRQSLLSLQTGIQMSNSELEPGKEKRVDLVEQLAGFSESERRFMLENLNALQLTEGCNGKCTFCFLAQKGGLWGVTKHYSFTSLKEITKKYHSVIRPDAIYYWGSDPFDYSDRDNDGNEHTYADVESLRMTRPFVSTALPIGSEKRFIAYNRQIIDSCLSAIKQLGLYEDSYHGRVIRISVGKQNIRRVEQVLHSLHEELRTIGYSEEDVNRYFEFVVKVETRFDPEVIGPLIDQHDDIGGANSFSCMDGVVITPDSISARIVTAPTIFEPSGEVTISLIPGRINDVVPQPFYSGHHDRFTRYHLHDPLLDFPRRPDGEYLRLEDRAKNVELVYGRAATSYAKFIAALAAPEAVKEIAQSNLQDRYFHSVANRFKLMQQRVRGIHNERLKIKRDVQERLAFYKLLCEVYSTQMEFILSHWRRGTSIQTICSIASEFRKVGKDNVKSLEDIKHFFPRSMNVTAAMSRALS